MFQHLPKRGLHYAILTALALCLYLPNLGQPSLWDIDEGNNVEAFREMLAADNWHVPTFNFQLRVDKPALLYWLQIFAALQFGVGEFAGRLPSALAALVAVLTTYELGRRAFGAGAGLLGGIALATAALFGAAAHFANPDALLCACTILTFWAFWCGLDHSGRIWFIPVNAFMALAVLAKGPVGIVLPLAVTSLYLLRSGRLGLVLDRRAILGAFVFLLIALPWYIWVGVDTKFEFIRGFIGGHNFGRALKPMEGHGGPPYYYLLVLCLGFAPWSVFLLPTCWQAYRDRRRAHTPDPMTPARGWFRSLLQSWTIGSEASRADHARAFLWCWILVYLFAFTLAATKLPNYILPIYPAVGLLTGDMLERWRRGTVTVPRWMFGIGIGCVGLIGIGMTVGLLVISGAIDLPQLRNRCVPELRDWALLGIVPLIGSIVGAWLLYRDRRSAFLGTLAAGAGLVLVPLGAYAGATLDRCKAPRPLAQLIHQGQTEQEIRVAAYGYFQPSLVFYCRRQVTILESDADVHAYLQTPLQVFLVTPVQTWERLQRQAPYESQVLGRKWDIYRGCDVLVIANRK